MEENNNQNNQVQPEPEMSELDIAKKQADDNLNGWKRAQADFINYKKDENQRVKNLLQFGNQALILEVIERLDNLERVVHHVPPNIQEQNSDWLKGVEQSMKSFEALLKKHDVERIEIAGEFNPAFHEAVQMEPGGTKLEEVQSGWTMHGKVIRPARVKITN